MAQPQKPPGVPLPDPDQVQESVQAFLDKFRANPGLYIGIGVVLLAVVVAVTAVLSAGPTQQDSAYTPLAQRYGAARELLGRDLSAGDALPQLEAHVETVRGTSLEGIGLWYCALANYREAWTGEKVSFEQRRPHLEKAIAYLEELEDQRFDDLLIAKGHWFTLTGEEPTLRLLRQARDDLAWAREHAKTEPEPDESQLAVVRTELGDIYLRFYGELAPAHTKAFITNAKTGTYNGTAFHYVRGGTLDPVSVSGGDPYTFFYNDPLKKSHLLRWGSGSAGFGIPPEEARFRVFHRRGIVTSTRAEKADWDNDVQFQIMVDQDRTIDRVQTPFAKVVEGMDVVDKITQRKTASQHATYQNDNAFARVETRDLLVEPVLVHKVIVFEDGVALEHDFRLEEGERKVESLRNTPSLPLPDGEIYGGRELRPADVKDPVRGRHFPLPADVEPNANPLGERRNPEKVGGG